MFLSFTYWPSVLPFAFYWRVFLFLELRSSWVLPIGRVYSEGRRQRVGALGRLLNINFVVVVANLRMFNSSVWSVRLFPDRVKGWCFWFLLFSYVITDHFPISPFCIWGRVKGWCIRLWDHTSGGQPCTKSIESLEKSILHKTFRTLSISQVELKN